ncbi:uncharacterized protein LOC108450894 [Gossypium arboreum]|uniref:CCHC-type domain-containing protein n=1 Tax=Gossypium arboreum TaxID=29729 RepID=A0ABR0Q4E9_GOSAR|nr:uncharacterized protein LOC108450894 [Gossypium arboreum]KAK5833912.1 hypothetical protein PVK06_017778 [Gossypium arboreum]
MKNHGIRPTGTVPLPEVNVAVHNKYGNEKYKGRNHGCGRGCSGGSGRGRTSNRYHGVHNSGISNHQKKNSNEGQERGGQNNPSKVIENFCYRCGMRGHWACTSCMHDHLVELYQASIKGKKNNIETNFISKNDEMEAKKEGDVIHGLNDITHLDVIDFFENH